MVSGGCRSFHVLVLTKGEDKLMSVRCKYVKYTITVSKVTTSDDCQMIFIALPCLYLYRIRIS